MCYLSVQSDRSIENTMHAQNSRLRRVDDRGTEEGAENATVADCERSALHVLDCELVLTRSFTQ